VNGSDVSRIRSDLLLDALAEAGRTSRYSTGTPKLVAQVLAEIPIFAGLSGRQRRRIAEHTEIGEIKSGETIVREGFTGEAAFVLLTGAARVERAGDPVVEVRSGALIGELSLLSGQVRSATVTATRDLWVLRIRRETFRRLLEQEPTIAVHLLENLSRRLWEADQTSSP
jgi:CRP/FNR family cyclic AMP-dependent transcriptional regulator